MVTITGPALAIVLVVGYLGINTIVNGIGELFSKKEQEPEKENK